MIAPTTIAELGQAVRDLPVVQTQDHPLGFSCTAEAPTLSMEHLLGITEYSPADQVVTVLAGTSVTELNQELATQGQCIPHLLPKALLRQSLSLKWLLDYNLPHLLEHQCSSWRDWILGMRLVLADGTICKAGSKVVKNVAGYDVHKLMVGARGTLAVVAEITLRTYPKASIPEPDLLIGAARGEGSLLIVRTLPTSFQNLVETLGDRLIVADRGTSTVWAEAQAGEGFTLPSEHWWMRCGCGAGNLSITDATLVQYMKRAKQIFDPENRLNPGAMGVV